jgi:hypothetical protein
MKIRQHFRWLWIHALEFGHLSLTLSRDSTSEPELPSSSRRKDVLSKNSILEASLIKESAQYPST